MFVLHTLFKVKRTTNGECGRISKEIIMALF
jgi:hypothetical protein